ncbi:MAG: tRNA uridine-5-carboxymethylaminomethyl(34) synthesis GTPase MnmE [Alphaproteobacteria bacterium]
MNEGFDQATIFTPATAPGRAGIAVIRLSGMAAGAALAALAGDLPPPRRASRRRLRAPHGGPVLDHALVLWFPGPASYTGEDAAELHLHGGPAVVAAVIDALATVPGLRPAEPGEFTRRAFYNGTLDLTAVEGLADLIAAESEAQRRQALRQLDGVLGALYDGWRADLGRALAHVEAAIDFSDEDLPDTLVEQLGHTIGNVSGAVTQHLDDNGRGERLRDGLFVAIVGAPNVGKSSLLNRLARRDAAIVSDLAGTTRDVIEVHLDLGGLPVTVADTAGLRDGVEHSTDADPIEAEGMRRSLARAGSADLKIAVFDAGAWPDTDDRTRALVDDRTLVAVNKVDRAPLPAAAALEHHPVWPLSCTTGYGLDDFVAALGHAAAARLQPAGTPALTRSRHRAALTDCAEALARYPLAAAPELGAEELRLAMRALGRITGRVDVEDLLDVIFAEFCIGK